MIRDASSHRRRLLATCHAQTLVRRAEVIDGADHVHPLLQGQRAARQRPASACQRRQALTERRIEPLDICSDLITSERLLDYISLPDTFLTHSEMGV